MTQQPTAAGALYPHLKSGTPQRPQRRAAQSISEAMFPNLARAPKPRPPEHPLLPRLTREQAMDWSNVDPRYARLVGLLPKQGRR
jgi:hypothetical protein